VEGQLHLEHLESTIDMRARVVEYAGDVFSANCTVFSFHGRLAGHDNERGELVLDDGRTIPVMVDHGLLRSM
jgi:hypothetical protein